MSDPAETPPSAAPESAVPTGTYRFQLRGTREQHFGFSEAAALAPYLAALGVSHVYLSPVLQAAPGSTHGYDVADHDRLADELGGADAFAAMAAKFRACGLKVLVDVVPNHMAIPDPPDRSRALASVLAEGPDSPYARWFDVDWDAGDGRLVLPGRGTPNYRRFFDISGLIGLRQEDPEVFERTHRLTLDLIADGQVHGLRIDHPDGLTDPRAYLERLAAEAGGAWTVVEKITTGGEELPRDWRCAGTTGYDALGMVGGLFVDPQGDKPLTETYAAFTGGAPGFAEVEYRSRRHAAEHGLRPEIDRLLGVLRQVAGPDEIPDEVLVELLAAMPVYRAYVVPGEEPPPQAVAVLEEAVRRARPHLPDERHDALGRLVRLVLGQDGAPDEFVVRFQQTSAPLAAKGVEDTAFYRWNRMAALNEVGGDPERFAVSPDDFHAYCARIARDWPATMTTLSTHDTKRQEDVRARLAVLAELPGPWAEAVERWSGWLPGDPPLEKDLEYLLWQTLAGVGPISEERLTGFLTKAMREAKTSTSWTEQNAAYEDAVLGFARRVLAEDDLTADIARFTAALDPYARVVLLGQKLVQLTMPGVPDVYQGCELTAPALVDPDNRRPVDYGLRRTRLTRLDSPHGEPRDVDDEKLLVTSRALRLRRDHPGWFVPPGEQAPHGTGGPSADYAPLAAEGPAAEHAVAFRRGEAITVATRLPVGLERRGGWGDTRLDLPGRAAYRNVLTGETHGPGGLALSAVLAGLPVALLIPEQEAG
ncbi:malto-oligosyltrehalose synthase [Actinomadura hibisca]|uniref:malto-oligosyltrehalose synthase n=1 Tax=Actinomadura hibisca TaxID=68565 RepID=UPI0008325F67|nr:malto-oligosyltrehalose synthase [Actinomadura hibisca]